jgi:hypothetical protein
VFVFVDEREIVYVVDRHFGGLYVSCADESADC